MDNQLRTGEGKTGGQLPAAGVGNHQVAVFEDGGPGGRLQAQGGIVFQAGFQVAFDGQAKQQLPLSQGFRDIKTLLQALGPVLKPLLQVLALVSDPAALSFGLGKGKLVHRSGNPSRLGTQLQGPVLVFLHPALDQDAVVGKPGS